ncbi:MAG TPA: MATE family efflux transporter [Methylomirabilota bacterium]|nr:MATE family efflux transporter [Methylomirabilota bacterium]
MAKAPVADGSPLGWHARRTVTLAWPIIVSRAGLIVLFAVDTFMAGQAGGLELAGLGLGVAPLLTVMLVSMGALQAAVVLAAQAIGRGEHSGVGDTLRAGLANAALLGVLTGLLSIWAEPFFLLTRQDPAVSAIAADVAVQFAWGLPGQLLFITANLMLEATDRPRVGMVVMLFANVLNVALDGVFVLGWGDLVETGGAATAMATSSVVRWLTFLAALAVLLHGARRDGNRHGILAPMSRWIRAATTMGGAEGREIRRMGLPMGLGQGVESAAFSSLMFFAGIIGTAALAAHQTTMTVMSLVYMNAVGLGGAASIRVGNAVGRRFPVDLARAGWSAIGLGGLFSGVCGLAMIAFPGEIASLVVDDPAAVAVSTGTLRFAGYFVAFDAMMGVAMGALRGLGDVWVPLWLQSAAFWFVAVPLAWYLGIHMEIGAVGLFAGIGAGILASLALLLPRFRVVAGRASGRWRVADPGRQDGAP